MKSVWIDYDISFGERFNEVDDAYALMHAIWAEKELKTFKILGLSTVFGNTDDMAFQKQKSLEILALLDAKHIPFYEGASKKSELGQTNTAVEALITCLENGAVTILAMGRMTNIASAVLLRPDLIKNIEAVILNGGRQYLKPIVFGRWNVIFPDTNIDGDARSMQELIRLNVPLVLVPTECMTNSFITKKQLSKMEKSKGPLKYFAKTCWSWWWIWKVIVGSKDGFIPWDVFIVSYLTHPKSFKVHRKIKIKMLNLRNDSHHLFKKKYYARKKDFLCASYAFNDGIVGDYLYEIDENHTKELVDFWTKCSNKYS